MASLASLVTNPVWLAYVIAFGLAAVVCSVGVRRAGRIDDDGTRRGLVWLLGLSGAWAVAHVGFLVAPTVELTLAFYYAGLAVGIAAVGPWLYFCSAYTGRSFHQAARVRQLAVATLAAILAVKFTNPIHGLYFGTTVVETPFPHLTVVNGPLHWIAMGLAYALSAVGYFMLVELFWQVGHDTRPLVALLGLMGLPVVLDVLGSTSPLLLDITYEPLGVAAFAAGVLYVFLEDFQTVRLAGERDDPVIVLDDEDRVRDYNVGAAELYPELTIDESIDAVVPEVAAHLEEPDAIIEIERVGGLRYYRISSNAFSTATGAQTGTLVTFTDVTEREQYRSELERQNERLDRFASVVSHDLRNPLTVAKGRIELAREVRDSEDLAEATAALDRMETLIDDLLKLAREGQPLSETETVTLSTVVEDAWSVIDSGRASLVVGEDLRLEADPERLQQLLENLLRNAIEHGSDTDPSAADGVNHGDGAVTITVGALADGDGFYVADDGPGVPPDERDGVFEFGYTTTDSGTGFGLAIVKEVADAHGWDVAVVESEDGGARFEITDADAAAQAESSDTPAEPASSRSSTEPD